MQVTKLISSGARLWLTLLCLALIIPMTASAQMATSASEQPAAIEVPDNLSREEVRDLIARLSDAQVRELIIGQLDKRAVTQDETADAEAYVGQMREGMQVAWDALARTFTSGDKIHLLSASIWRQITEHGKVSGWFLLFQLIGILVAGAIAEGLAKRMLERARSKPLEVRSLGRKFDLACFGAAMGMLELGAFAGGALLFIEVSGQHAPAAQSLWYELVWCLVMIKLVLLAVREIAAPGNADMRLVSISDGVARQTWAWALILMASLVLPLPLLRVATEFGADVEADLLMRVVFGVLFVGLLIVLVIRMRHYGARLIAGDDAEAGGIR
ncbi:MAG: hypothetical protein GY802_12115 [Gammaproteobacteria bacterium]|nr:hypothetical protein [Gammaproteobacteria bacterium]